MLDQIKKIGRHSLIYGIGIMATQAIGFILIPIYTRVLTTADYGVYEIISRSLEVFNIFLGVGLRITAIRFYQDGDDLPTKNKVISTAILFLTPLSVGVVLFMQAFAPDLSVLLFDSATQTRLVRLALFLGLAELGYMIPAAFIIARVRSVLFICVSTGKFAVGILLNLYLVYHLRLGVEGILLANLINSLLFSGILMLATLKEVGLCFDRNKLVEMLRFSLPFVPGGVFLFILNSGDRFFLLHYGGEGAVGIYALGYRFAMLIFIFVMQPFLQVWSALMVPITNKENGTKIIARVFTYVIFLYIWVGLGLSVLSEEAVGLVADAKFHAAHHIVPIVVLAYLLWSTTNIGDTPFYVRKRTGIKPFLLGAAAVVNLVLYRVLIPAYGGWGAAWATVISFAFFAVLTRHFAQRVLKIPYENVRFAKMLVGALVVYGIARLVPWPTPDFIFKGALWLAFPAGLWAIGFFEPAEKKKILELWRKHFSLAETPVDPPRFDGEG